jgi:hypothetical protein
MLRRYSRGRTSAGNECGAPRPSHLHSVPSQELAKDQLIPEANKDDIISSSNLQVKDVGCVLLVYISFTVARHDCRLKATPCRTHLIFPPFSAFSKFWAEEITRVWKSLRGILRHLAVLKFMQIMQRHRWENGGAQTRRANLTRNLMV